MTYHIVVLFVSFWIGTIQCQQQHYTTPVPILKQINRQNEDGSYSYGFQAGDGTFKIETKYPNGEIYGKYGYTDDKGQVRTVEYGATQRGFEPAGNEIQVPPPTITDGKIGPLPAGQDDDGQYREDPSIYYRTTTLNVEQPIRFRPQQYHHQQFAPITFPQYNNNPAPPVQPQPVYYPSHYNAFQGHPATNIDLYSGSYSINY